MSKLKTTEEIELLRESGRRLSHVLHEVAKAVRPGVTTRELDAIAERLIREGGDVPPFKDYTPYGARKPYPASLCVSVNDEIVHGIPGDRVLEEGDIVGIDLGLSHQGLITDMAMTVPVGAVSSAAEGLMADTERALMEGINVIRPGGRIGDIGAAIERIAHRHHYGIIRELGGHGVGHKVHEEPFVPNYGHKGTGPILKPGMVLALEPMFTLGREPIRLMPDGYTIITEDGSLAAHFEHTIVVTDDGAEILTL